MPPRMLADGTTKIAWKPSGVTLTAPTQTELRAGTLIDLSCFISKDNWRFGVSGNAEITDPPLCTTINTTDPGQPTYESWAEFFRYTTTAEDVPWTTFTGKGLAGYIIVRIGVASATLFTSGDLVRVYEVITGTPQSTRDFSTYHKFRQMYHTQAANERAVVA